VVETVELERPVRNSSTEGMLSAMVGGGGVWLVVVCVWWCVWGLVVFRSNHMDGKRQEVKGALADAGRSGV
jgi:hypothetical protein